MTNALGKVIKASLSMALITGIFSFMPIKIGLPTEIYQILTDGFIKDVFQLANYFFPVNFAFTCFLTIFVTRHFGVVINIVTWIYNLVTR